MLQGFVRGKRFDHILGFIHFSFKTSFIITLKVDSHGSEKNKKMRKPGTFGLKKFWLGKLWVKNVWAQNIAMQMSFVAFAVVSLLNSDME